jgi:type II secretory pathway pseudopilin PulG
LFGKQFKHQAGFALLIFLVVMMGLGGIALTGVTQSIFKQVEDKKFRHNERVLKEAKNALLQYSYNYPQLDTTGQVNGPGRLPCADANNNGMPSFCNGFGRLPIGDPDLNLNDIRDADGERLWYAVSSNFRPPGSVNSDSSGRISIRDQSGRVVYDGSNPSTLNKYGVAAVIIAPGSITSRNDVSQDRSVANGDNPFDFTGDSDLGIIDAVNYLDRVVGTEDNATFKSGSATDGFILGPVNGNSTNAVNDQMIIITAAEVIEMAEKATFQAYRDAIEDYRTNIRIGTPTFDAYPWLDNYTNTFDDFLQFDADIGIRLGRVPSIFSNYFAVSPQASQLFQSILSFEVVDSVNLFPLRLDPLFSSSDAPFVFNAAGDLTFTPTVDDIETIVRYFWDEAEDTSFNPILGDGWQECLPAVVTFSVQDCNQALAAPGIPDSSIVPNELATRVVKVTTTFNLTNGVAVIRPFVGNAGNPVVYQGPGAGSHAQAAFEYTDPVAGVISVDFIYDNFYRNSFDITLSGDLNYLLGVRYYPVLPAWALRVNDNWHNSIQMAYSSGYQPGVIEPSCVASTDCLSINNAGTILNNSVAVLVMASDSIIVDTDGDGLQNDLGQIFDLEQSDVHDLTMPGSGDDSPVDGILDQDVFAVPASNAAGNDNIFIIR